MALAWIDIYESRSLTAEFGVLASVIRCYESRTAVVPTAHYKSPLQPVEKGGRAPPGDLICSTMCQTTGATPRFSMVWYRFRPPPWFSGTRSVPLVVFLHGAGECGSDNVRQLHSLPSALCEGTMRNLYPCALLAPQCPKRGGWAQRLDAKTDLLDGGVRMIDDVLADSRIDPNRVYLIGLSMGGFGTWELAMRAPERFAAVVPICGGGDESRAGRLVNVPLWAVHGAEDEVVPVAQSRTMIEAVEKAGGEPRYLEMPGVGHDCWKGVFRLDSEVLAWMFRQARGSMLPAVSHETSDTLLRTVFNERFDLYHAPTDPVSVEAMIGS